MGLLDRFKRKKEKPDISFNAFPHLKEIKPKESYVFHSDYFKIDDYYATIMGYFHTTAASDNFGPFWGVNRIPSGLPDGVTTINFEQIDRKGKGWVDQRQTSAEGVAEMNENSQLTAGSNQSKTRAQRSREDLRIIAQELNDGASYLNVQDRIMIKAPSLEKLDEAVSTIERLYIDRFGTIHAAPYTGEQRAELSTLFSHNRSKKGKGFHFTSTEFAGSYSLVTHGLEDSGGEFVGHMVGDVNNSAVLFDVDRYDRHVVIASEQKNVKLDRANVSDMWGSKLSQSALLNNGRVVHIILNRADLDKLGPCFDGITYRIDMNQGDVNMFEMFGDREHELSIFPSQMQKLVLMAEQAYETTDSDRSVIRGSLEEIATRFYIDNRMWYENAASQREKLRIVGIPHSQVPKLEMFVSYLDMEYKAMANRTARDDEKLHALSVLSITFANLLSNNGDLFNTITSDSIDGAKDGRRVIYDFSQLMRRGKGVAMAQLVNVIGFAVGNLGEGDVVIFHGSEHIDEGIRDYVNTQIETLYSNGGRVAFLYNDMEKLLENRDFNRFDRADYTIFGNMTVNVANKYQTMLGRDIPPDLVKLVTERNERLCYIRRDFDNVVFHRDLQLIPTNVKSKRQKRRSIFGRKGAK